MNNRIIFTILLGFLPFLGLAQNCPANINNSPGNAPQTIDATIFGANGEILKKITCQSTGNSQQIDCELDDLDLTGAQYLELEINQGNNSTDCFYDIDGNNIGALPVEFGKLKATKLTNENKLEWNTFSEQDNDYFLLEYSFDGENWEFLTTVDGAGNTNSESNYEYNHRILNFNIVYYRLSQTDFDGTTVLLKTLALQNKDKEDISFEFSKNTAKIFSKNEINDIVITDMQGRRLNYDITSDDNSFVEIKFEKSNSIKILTVSDINGGVKRIKLY